MRSSRSALILGCGLGLVALITATVASVLLASWMRGGRDGQSMAVWVEDYYERVNDGDYVGALALFCEGLDQGSADQIILDVQEVIRWVRPMHYTIDGTESLQFPGAAYTHITVSVTSPSGHARTLRFTVAETGGDPCIEKIISSP